MRLFAGMIFFALATGPCRAEPVLKQEPAMGALKEGQRVLVDDGSCGAGKLKEVTGGNHVLVGGNKRIVRTRRCIDKK